MLPYLTTKLSENHFDIHIAFNASFAMTNESFIEQPVDRKAILKARVNAIAAES